jgi:hypothetical protein
MQGKPLVRRKKSPVTLKKRLKWVKMTLIGHLFNYYNKMLDYILIG